MQTCHYTQPTTTMNWILNSMDWWMIPMALLTWPQDVAWAGQGLWPKAVPTVSGIWLGNHSADRTLYYRDRDRQSTWETLARWKPITSANWNLSVRKSEWNSIMTLRINARLHLLSPHGEFVLYCRGDRFVWRPALGGWRPWSQGQHVPVTYCRSGRWQCLQGRRQLSAPFHCSGSHWKLCSLASFKAKRGSIFLCSLKKENGKQKNKEYGIKRCGLLAPSKPF